MQKNNEKLCHINWPHLSSSQSRRVLFCTNWGDLTFIFSPLVTVNHVWTVLCLMLLLLQLAIDIVKAVMLKTTVQIRIKQWITAYFPAITAAQSHRISLRNYCDCIIFKIIQVTIVFNNLRHLYILHHQYSFFIFYSPIVSTVADSIFSLWLTGRWTTIQC